MAKKLEAPGLGSKFEAELAEAGLSGFFLKVIERDDMDVEVLPTGLPRLDVVLHETKKGLALGRHVEIYSKDPEVGKTSLALQIGSHWQKMGKKVAIVDIEDTITEEYLVEMGYIVDPTEESGLIAPYLAKGFNSDTGEMLPAEQITDNVGLISRLVDLVIIDSIGALAKRADLEKEPGDSTMGGIGKIMWEHGRKYGHTKATKIWINQALPQIGVFSPAGIKYKTGGGNALPFFDSIKLELRLVEKLKGPKPAEDVYGVVVDVFTAKNKVSPPYRHVQLTYLNGQGFSPVWDLFEAALATKVIDKSGSWISFREERLGQGKLNAYDTIRASQELQDKIAKDLTDKLAEESANRG